MLYYKVKPSADQTRKNVNTSDILIANELYTAKEIKRFALIDSVYVTNYFDKINLSSKKTHFSFGARFANQN